MKKTRRNFLKKSIISTATAVGGMPYLLSGNVESSRFRADNDRYEIVDAVAKLPVLRRELFKDPVIIEKIALLRYQNNFICKVLTTDGAEGVSVSNNLRMVHLYPIFDQLIAPFFIGKDARNLDRLLEEVYVYKSNYKMQSYALWVPLATLEFAILDVLGKIAKLPMGALIGAIKNPKVGVYRANNFRGKSAEESIRLIQQQMEESDSNALKFKIGGRMSNNADYPSDRTEKLIPLIRKTFGTDMTVYADSNGSYTVDEAIRIGKMMQEEAFNFYEEPVPFDWYEETLAVKNGLTIPIAGGEQEGSMHNFRWLIANDSLDIVQPDIFYFGGMIRSMKVARMAQAVGKICVPHISGSGLGFLYMMHFVSALPNAGPYHEFKGFNDEIPMKCSSSDLEIHDGRIKVPTGPGLGVEIDAAYLAKHKPTVC